MKLTANFNSTEFACPCCGKDDIDVEFVKRLQTARDDYGDPLSINSGVRCDQHNAVVGGVDSSSHVNCKAGDIKCTGSMDRYKLVIALLKAGFQRIGIAKTFIHVDTDETKVKKVMWKY